MPGPPPPPPLAPPPMCPPPPPLFASSPSKSGSDNRGALLQSIRQGTNLKKTVTNDRSAPNVENNTTTTSKNNFNATLGGNLSNANTNFPLTNGLGLGGLFAGGMPKLRPTQLGKQLGVTKSNNHNADTSLNGSVTTHYRPHGSGVLSMPHKNLNNVQSDVQSALKKQMASDSNRSRGPPPPAPVRSISQNIENFPISEKQPYYSRNGSSNGLHTNTSILHKSFVSSQRTLTSPQSSLMPLQANSSTLHRKANSSANLTVFESSEITSTNYSLPSKPSNRKPNLAPKPPTLNGKPAAPPKKLIINGRPSGISRAQSMRSPRTPSPQSPEDASYHAKFGTVRNISSVIDKSLGQNLNQRPRPFLNGRPTAPPPSIPPQQTPPPPPSKIIVKPPNHAPPPPPNVIPQPPNHAPPPPPHRTTLHHQVPTRAPPAVPTTSSAPPPPPRHSSMRDAAGRRTSPLDLETKFKNEFHLANKFPAPGPYKGVPKFYSSKTVGNKQQAPLPPNHIQMNNRLWDASSC